MANIHKSQTLETINDLQDQEDIKLKYNTKPKCYPGMVGLIWKKNQKINKEGELVQEYGYFYTKEYSSEFTYGMMFKEEIDSVIIRLSRCAEYNLYPKVFEVRKKQIKKLLLLSFVIFSVSWLSLSILNGYFSLFVFLLLDMIFIMLFFISCARLSNNQGQYDYYMCRRDKFFNLVLGPLCRQTRHSNIEELSFIITTEVKQGIL